MSDANIPPSTDAIQSHVELIANFKQLLTDVKGDLDVLTKFDNILTDEIESASSSGSSDDSMSYIGSSGPTESSEDKCDAPKLVDYKPEYIDQDTIESLETELGEIFTTRHRRYTWLSKHNVPYKFGGHTHPAVQILKYQNIVNLMDKLNQEHNLDLDSCLVARYTTMDQTLNWHQDDEHIMDQTSPICNISIGPTRTIQFSKDENNIDLDFGMESGSILTMNPGCQSILFHRVLPGDESGTRYALSFRKVLVNSPDKQKLMSPKNLQPAFSQKEFVHSSRASSNLYVSNDLWGDEVDAGDHRRSSQSGKEEIEESEPCHLIIGDSLTKGLPCVKDTVTLSKGGAHPKDILELLYSNQDTLEPSKYTHMKSVTICVGTNALNVTKNRYIPMVDILTDYSNLVHELLRLFPNAKIGLFNVLPRLCLFRDTYSRITSFNMFLIDHIASLYDRVQCIVLYWEFVDSAGYLIPSLYSDDKFLHLSEPGKELMSDCISGYQSVALPKLSGMKYY